MCSHLLNGAVIQGPLNRLSPDRQKLHKAISSKKDILVVSFWVPKEDQGIPTTHTRPDQFCGARMVSLQSSIV